MYAGVETPGNKVPFKSSHTLVQNVTKTLFEVLTSSFIFAGSMDLLTFERIV